MKRCSKCGKKKSVSEFCKRSATKNSLHSWCKKCENSYCQKYHRAHKTEIVEYQKEYRQTHKAEATEYQKEYYQIHKTEIIENGKKWLHTLKGCLRHRFTMMKQRCNNLKAINYERYGGRGIQCLFKSFDEFFNYVTIDLGFDTYEKFKDLQIDRINNDEHYEKGNIRFVTRSENMRNTRRQRCQS